LQLQGKELPQIICLSKIGKENKIRLKRAVLRYLKHQPDQNLYLKFENEFLLNTKEITGIEIPLENNYITLPEDVHKHLQIEKNTYICFIQRPEAVAIKKFEVIRNNVIQPHIFDQESMYVNKRYFDTYPEPDKLLSDLLSKNKEFELNYDYRKIWLYDESFTGWKARKILDISRDDEEEIRGKLIQERLASQKENGSWGRYLTTTTRKLLELADLGMNRNYPQIAKAIAWLLNKPESPYNPGMFFATDETLDEQIKIIEIRKNQIKGAKPRFRKIISPERKITEEADVLYSNPCGPRLMWPNAFVLETLLAYGYETHERIQRMMNTILLGRDWCECVFQHGTSGFKKLTTKSEADIVKYEKNAREEFILGGIPKTNYLYSKESLRFQKRYEWFTGKDFNQYEVTLRQIIHGCEMITTQAIHRVKDELMRRFAEAHLWRFATLINNTNNEPILMKHNLKNSLSPYSLLKLFGNYDAIPSKIGILLSLPWIKKNQNEDGSWGDESTKESASLAVLSALKKIKLI